MAILPAATDASSQVALHLPGREGTSASAKGRAYGRPAMSRNLVEAPRVDDPVATMWVVW